MIRKFESEDIDKVMQIWKESTIKAHDFIDESYWNNNYEIVNNVYIPMSNTFVYDDGIDIKGFISIINNEFIGALFIDINAQNLGIGSELIDYTIKKYNKLSVAVYKDNKRAVEFYKNRDFKVVKEQANEDSGFKEYIMQFEIYKI
jgi:putative acetyltransferase